MTTTLMIRRLTVLAIFSLVTLGVAPAVVASDGPSTSEQVQELSNLGAQKFGEEQFEEAISYFEQAYELRPIPDLLFNIGRCYEQLGEWELAIESFEQYVRAPETDDEIRDHTMDRINSLRGFQRGQQTAADEANEVRRTARNRAVAIATEEVADPPSRFPGLATLGAGGGLVLGGLAFGLMANGNAERIDDTSLHYDERLDAQSSARTQGRIADGLYISGALVMAFGTYLLLFSGSDSDDASQAPHRLALWLDDRSAGMGFSLDF